MKKKSRFANKIIENSAFQLPNKVTSADVRMHKKGRDKKEECFKLCNGIHF